MKREGEDLLGEEQTQERKKKKKKRRETREPEN